MTYAPNAAPEKHFYAGLILRDDDGRFLMVYHSKKKEYPWRFPGGKLEPGELPIVAAARELVEELGVIPDSLYLYTENTAFIDGAEWTGFYFLCSNYRGTPTIQEPEKQGEIRYMKASDMPEGLTSPNQVKLSFQIEQPYSGASRRCVK